MLNRNGYERPPSTFSDWLMPVVVKPDLWPCFASTARSSVLCMVPPTWTVPERMSPAQCATTCVPPCAEALGAASAAKTRPNPTRRTTAEQGLAAGCGFTGAFLCFEPQNPQGATAPWRLRLSQVPRAGYRTPASTRLHCLDRGAIAQLGERLDRTPEYAGSTPASSTVS